MPPLNGFKLIALVPQFAGERIYFYYAVVDRGSPHCEDCNSDDNRYVVVCTKDPLNETWNYSVSYHDDVTEAMRALYVTANLHIIGKAIAEEMEIA